MVVCAGFTCANRPFEVVVVCAGFTCANRPFEVMVVCAGFTSANRPFEVMVVCAGFTCANKPFEVIYLNYYKRLRKKGYSIVLSYTTTTTGACSCLMRITAIT